MSLAAGTKLGPYEVLAPIGAGGMGEVYGAKDTKLKREVALKVLPEAFAEDPERMARFQREAEVLASLNHPNIAQIYGVEERALVMELVEGESPKGPMPFDEAWKIASQIAAGLEYAHEKGIVHRDLKPANVKITADGVVKLLDFGLAKAYTGPAAVSGNLDNSPTLTLGATQVGVILGTAAYMAPEQAKGKAVDRRADIWAFGVVLYELLTGERLFTGEDVSDVLADVLKKQPNLDNVPVQARRLLRECLEKDPKDRLRDIGDAKRVLVVETTVEPKSVSRLGVGGWISAGVLFIGLGIPSFLYLRGTTRAGPVLRYSITAPENTTNLHSFAISPDGHLVAIAATVNGKRQLWLRPLDAFGARPMPGTEDATYPFWSPDSRYIGFFSQGKLKKVPASGGPPQSLCDVIDGRGGTWSRQDVIVFSPNTTPGGVNLQRVLASGGAPADVTKSKGNLLFPVFLPDSRHFLYLVIGSPEQPGAPNAAGSGVYVASLDGNENRRVLADNSSVALTAGTLLFIRENTLMAQHFDEASGIPEGEVFPVAEGGQCVRNRSAAVSEWWRG
jgi:serine/threonine protein kinase